MKARKKGSNYEWENVAYVQLEGSDILFKEQYLEFQHDNLSTELKTYDQADMEKHWQDVRERAAIAAMQGLLSQNGLRGNRKEFVSVSVGFADELVKQLKGE